ncbi:FxSxx-COOH system tetratricopeptide repeat protein [Streptomyces sp. NPDC050504]|uniref:FxSxx-COOH system tetratricopeptide repeat protein n=1 Tax=Streptomyces sp. NPDC050504 TaxID=3365618 RepID=UPI003788B75D
MTDRNGTVITFYSYKGGTGRTMALANVAWILASNGHRVLTVDWDLEAPGLHRFFHPFLDPVLLRATPGLINLIDDYRQEALREVPGRAPDWHRSYARVRPHAMSVNWPFPEGGSLDFLSAGQRQRDYSIVGNMDWDLFYASYGGGQFFDAMRADMQRYYDYTLIDSRTGLSDLADICTVQMPQTLVVCFTLSDQSIEGAAAVAHDIGDRYRDRGIRILPVAMRIDYGEKDKVDAGRALARERFTGLPLGLEGEELAEYWGSVEIPYRPFYAYEEILAAFGDAPKVASSMLTSCERLTSVVTEGRITSLPPVGEPKRMQYVHAYTRRRPAQLSKLLLYYVSEDRMWADWLTDVLARSGFPVEPVDVRTPGEAGEGRDDAADAHVLGVVSQSFINSRTARGAWEAVAGLGGEGRPRVTPVRVSDIRLAHPYTGRGLIDLVRLDEAGAVRALLTGLDRTEALGTPGIGTAAVRFPETSPQVNNVRPRYKWFTGRASVLDRLRNQLGGDAPSEQRMPQVLYGLGGVGKTQLVREYAHRFKADYDLVWWIEVEQPDMVVPSFAELAGRMKLGGGGDVAEAARSALQALREGAPYARWLLILDNVEDLDRALETFPDETGPLPEGVYGHVLVTCRAKPTSPLVQPVEVEVFTREESVELLCRRVSGLHVRDADRVADAVGDLPLAIEVAAAWLEATATPVDEYVEQLKEHGTKVLSVKEAMNAVEYPESVGATWNISIARLRQESKAAARLLELCSFFAAEPISMSLIGSDSMIKALLPYDADLRDRYMLGKVTQALNRFALAKVDPADNSIQVHRLVQAAVRSGLSESEQEETMHEVHRILAEARPPEGSVDDPANWPKFELIWPHLGPSNVRTCDEEEPRQLLVDRIRYLWKRGDLHSARSLGVQLNDFWTNELLGGGDKQTLNLRFELANVLRSQGQYQEAWTMDEGTLAKQTEVLHEGHPSILITSGSVAADHRALGRFHEALAMDLKNYQGFREIFGEDHPRTLASANNLAIDFRLTGDSEAARRLDDDTVRRRTALLGPLHPYTLITKGHLARDLRELGDYTSSVQILREVSDAFQQVFNPDVPEVLRTAKSLAVSLRKAGQYAEARRLTEVTYARYRDRYGTTIPEGLACGLNLAADQFVAGEHPQAYALATEVLEGYRATFGTDHPFTMLCIGNTAIYQRALGEAGEAARHAEFARAALARALGDEHPFALCAAINLANALGDLGDLERTEEWERAVIKGLRKRFGPDHPDVLVCRSNLAVTLRAAGRGEEAQRLWQDVLGNAPHVLGETHPVTDAIRARRRVSRDLEPQQI